LTRRFFAAKALVVGEHSNGALNGATLSAISAGSKLGEGGKVTLLLVGSNADAAAKAAASVAGVEKVLVAKSLDHALAEAVAPLIANVQKENKFTHILAPASSFGKNVLPRVGAELDASPITDVIEIKSEDTFKRPIYAGNAIATVKSSDSVKLITVRGTAFPKAAEGQASAAPIAEVAAPAAPDTVSFEGSEIAKSDRPELTSASIVVSGGRALKSKENFAIIESLADAFGGAVGASRAAVDAGYAPNDWQVGQTGKIVAPELYIGLGISGAIQHVAGMKDSKVVVCINKDPEAPFFQLADYGLVGDLFQIAPELEKAVKAAKGK